MLLRAAHRLRHSRAARGAARVGLAARAGLYLLLAYLAAGVAAGWGSGRQEANANGALTTVAAQPGGRLALAGAAVGFAGFGLLRLAASYADRRVNGWRRLTTAGQALFYLGMAAATVSFVAGDHRTGSAQQEDSTAVELVGSVLGRSILAVVGVVIVCICLWQVRLAVVGGFEDSMATERLGRRARAALHTVGRVGIIARAGAVIPLGGLLLLAALRGRPREARDLDQFLRLLAQDPVGRVLVWVAAAGFVVFAVYSLVEVRFRAVHAGD